MIRVDRNRVPVPEILLRGRGGPADREFASASLFYAAYEQHRQRGGFEFKVFRHPTVKQALQDLFHGKCAYCETPLAATSPGDISLYRPKRGIIAGNGSHLPLHYWWIANEWSNLYLSCAECNRVSYRGEGVTKTRSGKGGHFPLKDEQFRAKILTPVDDLEAERPLLLDPCNDDVESILIFSKDGLVSSTDERGLTTIEILGLNRPGLVEARKTTANLISTLMHGLTGSIVLEEYVQLTNLANQLKEMMEPRSAYAGMCRQLISVIVRAMPKRGLDDFPEILELVRPLAQISNRSQERAGKKALTAFQVQRESYSLEDDDDQTTHLYLQNGCRVVERITIQNLRGISGLDLHVADVTGESPWLMLLGENATGKTTVLQALALALIGDRYRDDLIKELDLDLATLVKQDSNFGEIRVHLSGASEPRILRIHADGRVETRGREAQLILAAYGSTRLLPRRGRLAPRGSRYARIENLFDPFVPLADAQDWLLRAMPEETFDYAAIAIKIALAIDLDRELIRRERDVGLIEHGKFTPLDRLCDGYQTVIALIVDILSLVLPTWKTPELARGLVLIDEVGNHLHPSWKLRFVESLRSILPGVQVIATTHEPLCLRGLRGGEVAVLRKGSRGGIKLVSDLPSIEGMRIDQILTSEHFGLSSTLDPALQARFDRYNFLLRKTGPNQLETTELLELRDEINRMQQLGNSERERLLLAAIDRFLAHRPDTESTLDLARNEELLKAELAEIWEEAARSDGPST
ncbi:AAA family ATPase [Rhizobium ruizarguesonis]|jgi:uncharacterized protein (TIGR02646 family)